MILESMVTTRCADGSPHIVPMGPIVDEQMTRLELRPFQPSTTLENLQRDRCGVVHVVDDVLLLAQAAIGQIDPKPAVEAAVEINGWVLQDCCRWLEFRTQHIDVTDNRATVHCEIVHTGRRRDFFGFNRAKHAVIEAAILATRIDFIPMAVIHDEFEKLQPIVAKTGSDQELKAIEILKVFVGSNVEIKT